MESEVLRASLRLCRSRYPCIHLAADVLSGLARHQDRVAVKAVDAVLEAMHRAIEVWLACVLVLGRSMVCIQCPWYAYSVDGIPCRVLLIYPH